LNRNSSELKTSLSQIQLKSKIQELEKKIQDIESKLFQMDSREAVRALENYIVLEFRVARIK
jgi:predicted  nucleic acid-binding Zn-ribbon protein